MLFTCQFLLFNKNYSNFQLFNAVRSMNIDFRKKVIPIKGDLSCNELDLSACDVKELLENVQIVIHSAATVRFNEALPDALQINVFATRDLLRMAAKMKKLEVSLTLDIFFKNKN